MSAAVLTTHRHQDRLATSWNAECHVGDRILLGRVLDVTHQGAFFKPELGLTDGTLWADHEGDDAVEVGSRVMVKLVHRATPDVKVQGEVRWTGSSESHAVAGFGVEFLEQPKTA